MDAIVRSASMSAVAREIGRRRPNAAASASGAPVGLATPVAAPAAVKPAAVAPAAGAAPAAPSAAELKLEAALRERHAEIAQLRAQVDKVKAELNAIHADAEKQGYEAGLAKGEKAALQQLQVQIERARSVAAQLGQARGQVMDGAEDTLVEIAHGAVCRILGEQGATRATVERLVREALAGSREQLTVRLHPDDVALLGPAQDKHAEAPRLVADATIKLGGCIVDSTRGSLDARFETQLELLGAALLAVRAARSQGEDSV